MEFYILGDSDTILGFRFAGIIGTSVVNQEEALEEFNKIITQRICKILILTTEVLQWIEKEVTDHRLTAQPPYIVCIDDLWSRGGKPKPLEQLIYEAVGIRMVQSDEDERLS